MQNKIFTDKVTEKQSTVKQAKSAIFAGCPKIIKIQIDYEGEFDDFGRN